MLLIQFLPLSCLSLGKSFLSLNFFFLFVREVAECCLLHRVVIGIKGDSGCGILKTEPGT